MTFPVMTNGDIVLPRMIRLLHTVAGARIVHPMVTTQARLGFDSGTGALTVEPAALAPQLEIDLLQGLDLNGFDLRCGPWQSAGSP